MINTLDVMEEIPSNETLLLVDALLYAVYGWTPDKVRKMKLISIERWLKYAKKRMSIGDAFKLRKLLEPKEKSIWKIQLQTKF